MNRRTGKTFANVKAALEHNAVIICATQHEARRLTKEFGVETMTMHSNFFDFPKQRPVLFESTVIAALMRKNVEYKVVEMKVRPRTLREALCLWRQEKSGKPMTKEDVVR